MYYFIDKINWTMIKITQKKLKSIKVIKQNHIKKMLIKASAFAAISTAPKTIHPTSSYFYLLNKWKES